MFKRLHRNFKYPAGEIVALKAVNSEITVLGHPEIRGHPNIVRLVGMRFEIDAQTKIPVACVGAAKGGAWVFEQIYGVAEEGKGLSLRERLDLCVDIAAAVTIMHRQRHHLRGHLAIKRLHLCIRSRQQDKHKSHRF